MRPESHPGPTKGQARSQAPAYLLFFLLLLFLGDLGSLVLPHQLCEVSHVLIRLLQEVGQALVLLLVDKLAVPFLIFRLQKRAVVAPACETHSSISTQGRQTRVEEPTGDYC